MSLRLASIALALAAPAPLFAHGFGQRYDLPVPLWLYLVGAGATVLISFIMVAAFVPASRSGDRAFRLPLPGGGAVGRAIVVALRVAAVALFGLIVIAGLIGHQSPFKNIAPTMVWIVGWVGISIASALIGDIWTAINPWDSVARLVEWCRGRGAPRRSSNAAAEAMPRLDAWPAVLLFLLFAWCELIWDDSDRPRSIAIVLLGYSAVTWVGMLAFGRAQWLERGEIFSLAFGLFARFAPVEAAADAGRTRLFLRPYAVGLLSRRPASAALTCFVTLLLASVTFDGILETPSWAAFAAWGDRHGVGSATCATLGLIALPLTFLGVYLATIAAISRLVRFGGGVAELASWFIATFVPIALAYDIAHNLSYLALGVQYLIPILSDPLGFGWDLFGTKLYLIDTGLVTASVMWYAAVAAIVGSHVIAVYLAHVRALRLFPDRAEAMRSQIPLVALMVGYTMLSLWILAQPITNIRP